MQARLAGTNWGTAAGIAAILSWGTMGALGASLVDLAPNLVLGLCFAIAAVLGCVICWLRGERPASALSVEVLVAAGLLAAYHLSYLQAFHYAAPIPVSLINYLWPAWLIVIGHLFFRLNAGLPGYLGAACGFLGVAVLVGLDGFRLQGAEMPGYALAMLGAILWAVYSNLRRGARRNGLGAMVTICAVSSALCLLAAAASGESPATLAPRDMAMILLMGLGPTGGAFFLWDIGMRRGNSALLGVMGYSAPVISTALMTALGLGQLNWQTVIAIVMITLGGVIVQTGGARRIRLAAAC